ncbi:MAG: redoxin domain-containing protein, partial [Bacteroidetes bacterium]|nr:redoxin domain-containing protein [Bacteroidota bacterium]
MKKSYLLYLFLLVSFSTLFASGGYEIKVKIDGFEEKQLYMGYHYGDKQYLRDTTEMDQSGYFVFKGEEPLEGGMYLIVMPPDNKYFQVLLNEHEQRFTVHTKAQDPSGSMEIEGSFDNGLFYDYLHFLGEKRPQADQLHAEIEKAGEGSTQAKKLQEKLDVLNEEVNSFQENLISNHPNALTSSIVRANQGVEIPEFEGDEKEVQLKKWQFMRVHYFDNIDMADPRILRTPFLFQRVDYFISKLTVQYPDSINVAIDEVLEALRPAEESFKFYLIYFLNAYAKSNIVGMDAVYVHLVDKYYAQGDASWTEKEQLEKITGNADRLRPILIGKKAPDIDMFSLNIEETIKMKDAENEYKRYKVDRPINLHSVKADFTVLLFWAPNCAHCKKSMSDIVEFYDKFKDKGVEVFAVCTKTYKELPDCAEMLKEKNAIKWINAADPFYKSKFSIKYDVKSTPSIFIINDKKEIVSKR